MKNKESFAFTVVLALWLCPTVISALAAEGNCTFHEFICVNSTHYHWCNNPNVTNHCPYPRECKQNWPHPCVYPSNASIMAAKQTQCSAYNHICVNQYAFQKCAMIYMNAQPVGPVIDCPPGFICNENSHQPCVHRCLATTRNFVCLNATHYANCPDTTPRPCAGYAQCNENAPQACSSQGGLVPPPAVPPSSCGPHGFRCVGRDEYQECNNIGWNVGQTSRCPSGYYCDESSSLRCIDRCRSGLVYICVDEYSYRNCSLNSGAISCAKKEVCREGRPKPCGRGAGVKNTALLCLLAFVAICQKLISL